MKVAKPKKVADPATVSIDTATQEMLRRAQELGVETIFDRAVTMKPCNIGVQGTCCKNCAMGPCRLPAVLRPTLLRPAILPGWSHPERRHIRITDVV